MGVTELGYTDASDAIVKGKKELFFSVVKDSYGENWSSTEPALTIISNSYEFALGYITAYLLTFRENLVGESEYTDIVAEFIGTVVTSVTNLKFDAHEDLIPFKKRISYRSSNPDNKLDILLDTENCTLDIVLSVGGSSLSINIYSRGTENIHFVRL